MVTPGISWTKLCSVDGPIYSKITGDKMSPSCEFILLLRYLIYDVIFLFVMFLIY